MHLEREINSWNTAKISCNVHTGKEIDHKTQQGKWGTMWFLKIICHTYLKNIQMFFMYTISVNQEFNSICMIL